MTASGNESKQCRCGRGREFERRKIYKKGGMMGRVQRRGERKGINKGVQGTWASEGRRSRAEEKRVYHVSQCWSELEVTRSGAATLALTGK